MKILHYRKNRFRTLVRINRYFELLIILLARIPEKIIRLVNVYKVLEILEICIYNNAIKLVKRLTKPFGEEKL